jgi:hypothetical protein
MQLLIHRWSASRFESATGERVGRSNGNADPQSQNAAATGDADAFPRRFRTEVRICLARPRGFRLGRSRSTRPSVFGGEAMTVETSGDSPNLEEVTARISALVEVDDHLFAVLRDVEPPALKWVAGSGRTRAVFGSAAGQGVSERSGVRPHLFRRPFLRSVERHWHRSRRTSWAGELTGSQRHQRRPRR